MLGMEPGVAWVRSKFATSYNLFFICPVLVDQSDNATVMEGMPATFSCSFQSDLAVLVHWVRPSRKAIENNMEGFDPKDPTSFEAVIDPATGMSATGETLTITDTKTSDSGLYFCAGQTNSGMTPGFVHLEVIIINETLSTHPATLATTKESTFGESWDSNLGPFSQQAIPQPYRARLLWTRKILIKKLRLFLAMPKFQHRL